MSLKDILPLLISGQARLGLVMKALGLLIPFVWVGAADGTADGNAARVWPLQREQGTHRRARQRCEGLLSLVHAHFACQPGFVASSARGSTWSWVRAAAWLTRSAIRAAELDW